MRAREESYESWYENIVYAMQLANIIILFNVVSIDNWVCYREMKFNDQ